MKILHILTDSNIGGAGMHLLALLKSYDRGEFCIEVILPEGSRLAAAVKETGTKVIEADHIRDRSFSAKGVYSLLKLLREIKPQLVHTHASLSGRIAAKILGLPVIYTRHYCVDTAKTRRQINFFNDRVVAPSPEVARGLESSGINPKLITTIENGVTHVTYISPEEKVKIRDRYGISKESFVVVQVARLDPIKGHDVSLDAIKLLFPKAPDLVVLFAGDGPLEEHLKKRIKDEGIKNVLMLGFISKVEEIYNIADLQLNASFSESSCLALLEGMSLGIPAVVTDGGANPRTIPHGLRGLVVPCGDYVALAEAILTVKKDASLRRRLSEGALAGYNTHFRADRMARQMEALYREVVK